MLILWKLYTRPLKATLIFDTATLAFHISLVLLKYVFMHTSNIFTVCVNAARVLFLSCMCVCVIESVSTSVFNGYSHCSHIRLIHHPHDHAPLLDGSMKHPARQFNLKRLHLLNLISMVNAIQSFFLGVKIKWPDLWDTSGTFPRIPGGHFIFYSQYH